MSSERERAHQRLLRLLGPDFAVRRGHPLPTAPTGVRLVVSLPGEADSVVELPLDPEYNRTGDVWHVFLKGLDPGLEYGYRLERSPNREPRVHRFDRG